MESKSLAPHGFAHPIAHFDPGADPESKSTPSPRGATPSGRLVTLPGPASGTGGHGSDAVVLPPRRRELIASAGPPKADLRCFCITVWRHAVDYKRVLADLSAYRRRVSPLCVGEGTLREDAATSARPDELAQAQLAAQRLCRSLETYLATRHMQARAPTHPRRAAIAALLAHTRRGCDALDATRLQAIAERRIELLLGMTYTEPDRKIARQLYDEAGIPILARTMPQRGLIQLVAAEPLGVGGMNQTYCGHFVLDGQDRTMAFKPITREPARDVFGRDVGIDEDSPAYAQRNLASYDTARMLGFDVLVKTDVESVTYCDTKSGQPRIRLGLLMELAPGSPAAKAQHDHQHGFDIFFNRQVIEKVMQLQLLDQLTGQIDRHASNYFVHYDDDDGSVTVKGIDNDKSFGKLIENPSDFVAGKDGKHRTGWYLPPLAPVIDTKTAQAILRLRPDEWAATLKAAGLGDEEVGAALKRLAVIKTHIEGLAARGRVIEPFQWMSWSTIDELVRTDSYVARRMGRVSF